jgi:hypothetical protein
LTHDVRDARGEGRNSGVSGWMFGKSAGESESAEQVQWCPVVERRCGQEGAVLHQAGASVCSVAE